MTRSEYSAPTVDTESLRLTRIFRMTVSPIGAAVIRWIGEITYLAGALVGLLASACLPRTWTRTVRQVLVRQILFTGVESLGFISFIAILTGASLVLQAQVWLAKFGLSDSTGPLLVTLIIRELAPLVVNFVVIARSGNAIATEMGHMKVHGEIRALQIMGIDPGTYLVLPRVLGLCVSVCCLTIFFCAVSLLSGCLLRMWSQGGTAGTLEFLDSITRSIGPADVINVAAKTIAPALAIGIISCTEGLNIGMESTEVPQGALRAIKRSVTWVFVISAFVSAMTYL